MLTSFGSIYHGLLITMFCMKNLFHLLPGSLELKLIAVIVMYVTLTFKCPIEGKCSAFVIRVLGNYELVWQLLNE